MQSNAAAFITTRPWYWHAITTLFLATQNTLSLKRVYLHATPQLDFAPLQNGIDHACSYNAAAMIDEDVVVIFEKFFAVARK